MSWVMGHSSQIVQNDIIFSDLTVIHIELYNNEGTKVCANAVERI